MVDVETSGDLTRGWSLIDTLGRVDREPNATVVTDYDTEGFFELMLEVLPLSYLPPTRELRVRFDTAQALTRLFYREQAVVLACGGWIPRVEAARAQGRAGANGVGVRARRRCAARARLRAALPGPVPRRAGRGARARRARRPARARRPSSATTTPRTSKAADELADGPSIRIVEAALRDKERQAGGAGTGRAGRRRSGPRPALLRVELLLARRPRPRVSVRRGRRAPAPLGGQPPERGVGGRHGGQDPARALARARLGVHERRRPLALRRDPPHADGRRTARALGLRAGADPARRLHLRGLRRPGSRSTGSACSATSRRRTSAASASALRRSTTWATRPARPTWSSTGPTRRCTRSTAAAGCGGCWRRAGEDPESWPAVLERCERLVQERVDRATSEDLERIRACADALVAAAQASAAYPSRS